MELRTLTSPPRWSQTSPLFCAHFSTTLLAFTGKFSPKCKKFWSLQSSIHIKLNQRGNKVDCQHSSTLFQHWYLIENESWDDVYLSTLFQRSQNNVERITSIQRRWTNVVSTLKFCWKWKLSRHMFIDVVSTLTKQRWNNIDTSIHRRWPSVVSTLIVSWKWNLSQRIFICVASTLRKQHLNNFLNCCTNVD